MLVSTFATFCSRYIRSVVFFFFNFLNVYCIPQIVSWWRSAYIIKVVIVSSDKDFGIHNGSSWNWPLAGRYCFIAWKPIEMWYKRIDLKCGYNFKLNTYQKIGIYVYNRGGEMSEKLRKNESTYFSTLQRWFRHTSNIQKTKITVQIIFPGFCL